MPLRKNERIRLAVEAISSDGNGLGRHEGQVVFVPFAAVGDVLDIVVTKVHKTHAYGAIRQILTPGPGRITPDCPLSGKCGGCAFRHLSYEAELAAKTAFVSSALHRIGHIVCPVPPALPSPEAARYRNKVQYPLAPGPGGEVRYGFYAPRSHRVLPCEDCLLQPKALNDIAAWVVGWLARKGVKPYDENAGEGLARHIYLRRNAAGEVLLCLVLTRFALPDEAEFAAEAAAAFPQIKTVVLNANPTRTNVILGKEDRLLLGEGYITDTLCGVPLRLDVHSFAQVNAPAAERLFALAGQWAAPEANETILDLYCGGGVIGLSMARFCRALVGIDTVAPAIQAARESAAQMGLSNTLFFCSDAGEAAAQLTAEGHTPSIIILDPPRQGAGDGALAAILQMAPRRVLMISCNPATMARDLAVLIAGGYTLQRVQPVDMFPRTRHVECLCLLTRQ